MLLKVYGEGRPYRLFAAGMHGGEWKDTSSLLLKLNPPLSGSLFLLPLVDRGRYLSTLQEGYYKGPGSKIPVFVNNCVPEIYIEIHSYSKQNFRKLAGRDRISRTGVPPYSVLEEGLLLGSVSPHIRLHFPKEALCLSLEVQRENPASYELALHMLDRMKECRGRDDFIAFLNKEYPSAVLKAIENYKKFYGL